MKRSLPSPALPFKIGTRGSPLALWQAHEVRRSLMAAFELPEAAFEIVVIKVTGDMVQDRALKEIGGKGLFTKEIEEALLDHSIAIAVHSMKDMPVLQPDGLLLDCYLPREDVRDGFVSPTVAALMDLPRGAVVGSSSLRRRAQLAHRRPDLHLVEFRGNVQTRMKKLQDGVAVATFLAMAGLNRLGMAHMARGAIEVTEMLPAVAQGAIGVERRAADTLAEAMLAKIHHHPTGLQLGGRGRGVVGACGVGESPVVGAGALRGGRSWLGGESLRTDGGKGLAGARGWPVADGAALGRALGDDLRGRALSGFFS